MSGTIDIDPESLAQAGASLAALAEQMAIERYWGASVEFHTIGGAG